MAKLRTDYRTIRATSGHVIHVIEEEGVLARPHSITGPAFFYPEEEGKSPEYYIHGVKYDKNKWKEIVQQMKRSKPSEDFDV